MSVDFSLRRFEARLRQLEAEEASADHPRAAVAAILRFLDDEPEVLLMLRAEVDGDRWSGQVSMPGGREQAGDESLCATAMRETHEEVGVDLTTVGRLMGRLAPESTRPLGDNPPLLITPFVFCCVAEPALELGIEAVAAFWFPLRRAALGELDDLHRFRYQDRELELPCWRFEERVVWGLTYRMLSRLLQLVRG